MLDRWRFRGLGLAALLGLLVGCAGGTDLSDFDGDGVPNVSDCEPEDPRIFAGASDPYGDGLDSDCSGEDGTDQDRDGHAGSASGGPDCNDDDPDVHPGADEVPDDAVDQDCDGLDLVCDVDNDGVPSPLCGGTDCDDRDPLCDDDCQDDDGDGVQLCHGDCDDSDPSALPGNPEVCDGLDNDCDPSTTAAPHERDDDGDGWLTCALFVDHGAPSIVGSGDCDDADPARAPSLPEACDGVDNDCDSLVPSDELDQDLDGFAPCDGDCADSSPTQRPGQQWFADRDGDGDGDPDDVLISCLAPADRVLGATDCDDGDPTRAATLPEACDGLDNDCDSLVPADEVDGDGDGFPPCSGDCDDADPEQRPGQTWHPDVDQDGFGAATVVQVLCQRPVGWLTDGADCDDSSAARSPALAEACDGLDNDCDSLVPIEELDGDGDSHAPCAGDCDDADPIEFPGQQWFVDADGDGAGDPASPLSACERPAGRVPVPGDCDDADPTRAPSLSEDCDGVDNDCDGLVPPAELDTDGDSFTPCAGDCDDGDPAQFPGQTWFPDQDGDGFGHLNVVQVICARPAGWVDDGTDCDDGDPTRAPSLSEACDGVDNDCDALIPAGELDDDGDGVAPCQGDCDDNSAARSPALSEACDGVDNDCDSAVPADEVDGDSDGARLCDGDCDDADPDQHPGQLWLRDLDGDGFGAGAPQVACARPPDHTLVPGDCDDSSAARFPGNPETCDGLDNDCDATIPPDEADGDGDGARPCDGDCDDEDEQEQPGQAWYLDGDGDGSGDPASALLACQRPADRIVDGSDCDDADPTRAPSLPEVCDGLDNDCDAATSAPGTEVDTDGDRYLPCAPYVDRGASNAAGQPLLGGADCDDSDPDERPGQTWYGDSDGDGYGTLLVVAVVCARPDGYSTDGSDCDDGDGARSPAAAELCDGLDTDCDGAVPPDEADDDGDGARPCDGDCADSDPAVHPGAIEICDLVDNDCDGVQAPDEVDADSDTDPACSDCDDGAPSLHRLDRDGDGHSTCDGDCSDDPAVPGAASIHPGATDLFANGIDDDCDGVPGIDRDGDGHASLASGGGDCNDDPADPLAPSTHPGAADLVADGLDTDCDGVPGVDHDGDLHASLASGGDDCDDAVPSTFAGAADSWGNGVDEDCDGCPAPAGPSTPGDGLDADCDGFALNGPGAAVDCDDAAATSYPGAPDSFGDGVDADCDGEDGVDADGDHHASQASGGADCDDSDPTVHPGAPDSPGDGLDPDCDACDPGLTPLLDASGQPLLDGSGNPLVRGDGVDADCDGYAQNGGGAWQDCDDTSSTVFPGSTATWESPRASLDVDCDGRFLTELAGADLAFVGALRDGVGRSVVSLGDVDGDGVPDLLLGAPGTGSITQPGATSGRAFLLRGSSLQARLASGDRTLGPAQADVILQGEASGDMAGWDVAPAGDVDGDGLDDLLIGASANDAGGLDAGRAYLVLASTLSAWLASSPSTFALSDADATITGGAGDHCAETVSSAGDVDGDGLDDLLVACLGPYSSRTAGTTALFYGSTLAAGGDFGIGDADLTLTGEADGDASGWSLAAAGDVDGDGLDDVLIGAPKSEAIYGIEAGRAYLLFGARIAAELPGATSSLLDADVSWWVPRAHAWLGGGVSSAGDVDGDGLSDLLVGAGWYARSHVVLAATLLADLAANPAVTDLSLAGADTILDANLDGSWLASVAAAGDVDGDGLDDVVVGAPGADETATSVGKTYLALGRSLTSFMPVGVMDAAFVGEAQGDQAGESVCSAGDVDGDGYDDLLVGAIWNAEGGIYAGKAYLLLSPYGAAGVP